MALVEDGALPGPRQLDMGNSGSTREEGSKEMLPARFTNAALAATGLLATMVAMGALGALLTFAHRAYYAPHWLTTRLWGLSPIEDQQIAGIIMWAPASLVYLIAALTILYRSLGNRAAA